mmetsp:Transcript_41443/g.39883  ORF Transcript_41443/g.39883 Transcript_41443/m.39883 type:complete len:103 (-) Transcript_41443:15-323(-)
MSLWCYKVLKILFVLLVMWLFLRSPSNSIDFQYSMSPTRENQKELFTPTLEAKFYVSDSTLKQMNSDEKAANNFKKKLEQNLYYNTQNDCEKAKRMKNKLLN